MATRKRESVMADVIRIKTCIGDDQANEYLDAGWQLRGLPTWSEPLQMFVFFLVREKGEN